VPDKFNPWLEPFRFAVEVQGVISMRLMRIAQGGPQAAVETCQMVSEKLGAFADAEVAIAKALTEGEGIMVAAKRGYEPVRQCVHANSDRLSHIIA